MSTTLPASYRSPARLRHKNPALNIKDLFYVAVGETATHYLALIYTERNGEREVSSVVHAVSKSDFGFLQDEDDSLI